MLDYTKSFIETQFPVSKVSKESYKERKAVQSQTLTGLGKWWGRKPLIMVRAAVIASLLPVSDDPKKDKDIFLKIMTMDEEGLWERKKKSIPIRVLLENATQEEIDLYFNLNESKLSQDLSQKQKEELQKIIFNRMSYDEKLTYCDRPENISGPSSTAWKEINEHLHLKVHSLTELIEQLGNARFGRRPIVGDCFCGGGSNVYEPARIGCDVYASDLNPLASILTWAGLNILGSNDTRADDLRLFQDKVYDNFSKELDALGIETNEQGWKAKYYIYCAETICPECGFKVPISPSWTISEGNRNARTIALLHENDSNSFDIEIKENPTQQEEKDAIESVTFSDGYLYCPHCKKKTSMQAIRGGDNSSNMRKWGKDDWTANKTDLFQERLYAIKYVELKDKLLVEKFRKKPGPVTDATFGTSHYVTPTEADLKRELLIHEYLTKHFKEWQDKGYITSSVIEEGEKTDEPTRTRGWTYWHHLYNGRQLLTIGLLLKVIDELSQTIDEYVVGLLMVNKCCNFNSKLSRWNSNVETGADTFYNQALNTLYNHAARSSYSLYTICRFDINNSAIITNRETSLLDGRDVSHDCDLWITDPPYADAVNYHELTEFFLSWDKLLLKRAFPTWYSDTKRTLAIKGIGQSFNKSMVDVYRNLANNMPDNGIQIVMFTHQDTKVWAELAMILWSAGLRVTAAWCIATETDAVGLKQGNYVKGTVLMVLRKRNSEEMVFQDELYEEIREKVQRQIDSMRDLDNKDDPDFNDGDYLLAAYVAALKVLTSYKDIEGLDVQYELSKAREASQDSPVTQIINTAKAEAYDYLVPEGIDSLVWSYMTIEERYYIKCFEMELNGVNKMSAFQEVARGFGVRDYKDMLGSKSANQVRLKTPKELGNTQISSEGFGATVLRNVLLAINISIKFENTFEGRNYLKSKYNENNEYWKIKSRLMTILDFLSKASNKANMQHWKVEVEYASILKEAIRNDSM